MKKNKAEHLVDFNLRHSWHKISRLYNQKAKNHGLTMSMGFILLVVDKEGTPSTQLGPRMGMEPTSLSRTLKTMETKGYIKKVIDGEDKRRVLIFLTDLGVSIRREVREVVIGFNEKLEQNITKEKLIVFFEVMQTINDFVDDEFLNLNNTKI